MGEKKGHPGLVAGAIMFGAATVMNGGIRIADAIIDAQDPPSSTESHESGEKP